MRISDWSSDVCSSDLLHTPSPMPQRQSGPPASVLCASMQARSTRPATGDRKSVVKGKSVSVRVDLGGRRIIKKKNDSETHDITQLDHNTAYMFASSLTDLAVQYENIINNTHKR